MFTLAGLALHAEHGACYERSREAILEHYVTPDVIKQVGRKSARDTVDLEHRKHHRLADDSDAEIQFVEVLRFENVLWFLSFFANALNFRYDTEYISFIRNRIGNNEVMLTEYFMYKISNY